MSAEEATASVAAAGRLLADLEHASAALSELVRKSPRDDVIESARLSAESQLQSLEEELGALVFAEDYAPAEERNRAEEEGRLDELVLSPEDVASSFEYQTLDAKFHQDVEKSRNIGVQRTQRLFVSFEHFRREQDQAYRRKLHKLRNRSGIDKLLQAVTFKERQLEKLSFELRSKRELLDEAALSKRDGTTVPESQQSQQTYAEKELYRLCASIDDGRRRISQALAQQGECDALVEQLRQELSELVYDGARAGGRGGTSSLSSTNMRMLTRMKANRAKYSKSQHVALDMLDDSYANIKRLVDENAHAQHRIATVESEIKLKTETLDVLSRTDAFRELKRLRELCRTLQSQTASFKDKSLLVERSLLSKSSSAPEGARFHNFDSYEGKQFISHYLARKSNRESVVQAATQSRIASRMPKPQPPAKQIPLTTYIYHISPQELAIATQTSCLLKSRLPVLDKPQDYVSPILKSSQLREENSVAALLASSVGQGPTKEMGPVAKAHLQTMLSIGDDVGGNEDDGDCFGPRDDFGIPAILEQLQIIEDMLNGAPKRKPYDFSGGVEDIREQLVLVNQSVVQSYKAIKATNAAIEKVSTEQDGTADQRDAIRVKFLAKIAGRDGMPLTITARQDEVTRLTNLLLDGRGELRGLKKLLRAKELELEGAQRLYENLKATPGLAALEVDRLEAQGESPPKPLIRVDIKPKEVQQTQTQKDSNPKPKPKPKPNPKPKPEETESRPRPTTPDPPASPIFRVRVTLQEHIEPRVPAPLVTPSNAVVEDSASVNDEEIEPEVQPPPHRTVRVLQVAPVVDLHLGTELAPRGPRRQAARPRGFVVKPPF